MLYNAKSFRFTLPVIKMLKSTIDAHYTNVFCDKLARPIYTNSQARLHQGSSQPESRKCSSTPNAGFILPNWFVVRVGTRERTIPFRLCNLITAVCRDVAIKCVEKRQLNCRTITAFKRQMASSSVVGSE
jgi:hypothetical protein